MKKNEYESTLLYASTILDWKNFKDSDSPWWSMSAILVMLCRDGAPIFFHDYSTAALSFIRYSDDEVASFSTHSR
jgi:hypothetical protein